MLYRCAISIFIFTDTGALQIFIIIYNYYYFVKCCNIFVPIVFPFVCFVQVVKQCCATDGVEAQYIRDEVLPSFFKHFWQHRMALDRRNYRQVMW